MAIATVESLLRVSKIIYENEFPINDVHNLAEKMKADANRSKKETRLPSVFNPQLFYLVPHEKKGHGLACSEKIEEGRRIMQYVGVYSHDDFVKKEDSWYCFHTGKRGWRIEAKDRGGLCRFVNHSCRPNCIIKSLWYGNQIYCFLEAIEDIPKDTELTYDYNFTLGVGAKNQVCLCGSGRDCSGLIGKVQKNKEYLEYVCKTCKKICKTAAKLKEHERVHTGERPFVCDVCHEAFTTKCNLKRHLSTVHLKQKSFQCPECKQKLSTRFNLEYHVNRYHKK